MNRAQYSQDSARKAFFDPSTPPHYPPDLQLEPQHLDIDLFVDVANEQALGKVTTTVVAQGQEAAVLVLDGVDLEDVAVRDVDGFELNAIYNGRKLTITWAQPFQQGEERRVEVSYKVIKPVDGLIFSQPDESYPEQGWYAVTDHETERARYWLPCIDLPNVRTALDFHLRAEERFTILANGALVEEINHGDGTKTAHWRLEQRCPSYLTCFAIGDFVTYDDGVFDDGQRQIPLAYFCSREHTAEDLGLTFGRTRKMMTWMTQKLDMPFPYPKYYQFAVPQVFGAMENISLVSWNDRYIQDATLAQELQFRVDMTNLHEMSHSYFGDAIVCRDFAHTWLKESWAVYMEQVYLEENATAEDRDYRYFDAARRYILEADNRYQRPIVNRHFQSSWEMFDAHTYPGGACRLHTLRKEIGDEVFWTAVRNYLKRYYGKVVETEQFRMVMEDHSGRSLGQFFDQWFYTAGYPNLKVSFDYDEKKKQGTFTIEQKQVNPEKNIPAFVLNTDLGWTINGQDNLLPVKLDRERQTFIVAMDEPPQQVRFDPQGKVLHKLSFNPGDPLLRNQLSGAADITGRILAAEELVKTGKHANIQVVVDAYATEPYWGVRLEMARALAKANHETAVAGLAQIVSTEAHPQAMPGVFTAAGAYRDGRILDALLARLENDLPYLARQAALESLGKQRKAAPLDLLLAASEEEGFNGIVQAGAFSGLAETRREEALDPLLSHVAYGAAPDHARQVAVAALGDIGKGQNKARREQIVETLSDLLRDPWFMVHDQAARSLKELGAVEAIPALKAYSKRLSYQDQVDVENLIIDLAEEDKVDGSALKKQVEDLQEKISRLEDRVETLAAQADAANAESSESG
ncbi:MAG: M1 family aminopeptidase [Candidatus Promineifilaceae bacterium]|jgi:aminopeptidase N